MGFSAPKVPPVPAPPPQPPAAPPATMANPEVAGSAANARSRAAAASGGGFSGTVQNIGGASGLTTQSNTAPRSLLG